MAIESDTTEARKARLLQVLRLYTERTNLTRGLAQARVRDRVRALDRALAGNINLRHADLIGANLKDLDLRGMDLTDADLTDADVTGTLFGNNPGLTEEVKRDLQQRGAIFLAFDEGDGFKAGDRSLS